MDKTGKIEHCVMCLEGDVSYATHVLSHQQAANIQEYDCQPKMDKKLQKYKIL